MWVSDPGEMVSDPLGVEVYLIIFNPRGRILRGVGCWNLKINITRPFLGSSNMTRMGHTGPTGIF